MKRFFTLVCVLLFTSICYSAEVSFLLSFDGKTINPEIAKGVKVPLKDVLLNNESFIKGFNNGDAYVLTGKENPTYAANNNLNYAEGTVSFWFKPINWPAGKSARFLHVYSPEKGSGSLIIFYFFKHRYSEDIIARIYTVAGTEKNEAVVKIPGKEISRSTWQKVDVAWDQKKLNIYLNGKMHDEKPMPPSFALLANKPRDWSSIGVTPVIVADGDDWDVKTAVDDIVICKNALSAQEINDKYQKDIASAQRPAAKMDAIVIKNDSFSVGFADGNGGFGCTGIAYKAADGGMEKFIFPQVAKVKLFQLEFQKPDNDASFILDNNSDCEKSHTVTTDAQGNTVGIFHFKNLNLPDEPGVVDVTVRVVLDKILPKSSWYISVENNSKKMGTWSVIFPAFKSVCNKGTGDLVLPTGNWGGQLFKNSRISKSLTYPNSSCPTQFFCYTKNNKTLYIGAHDPGGWGKEFNVNSDQDIEVKTFTENMGIPGKSSNATFPVVVQACDGNWWKAAKLYRQWALEKAPWTQRGLVEKRNDVPVEFKEIGLWMIGGWVPSQGVQDSLIKAAALFQTKIGTHWYEWHVSKFDFDYPELKPKPGFAEAVKNMTQKDILVMPYLNGHVWDQALPSYAQMKKYACMQKNGKVYEEMWGRPPHPFSGMCPYTKAYQDFIAQFCIDFAGTYKLKALYLDQIGAVTPSWCFDPSHGHPLGTGSYWMDGYRKMISKIKQGTNGTVAITTENTEEIYMDTIDGFLTWDNMSSEDIPLLAAVYSGYTAYFGSPSDEKDDLDAFAVAHGRGLLWGNQLGWNGGWLTYKADKYMAKIKCLDKFSKYRLLGKKFLIYGELLGELTPLEEQPLITTSHYYRVTAGQPREVTLPAVMSTLWRASDGALGIFIVNMTPQKRMFSFSVDAAKWVPELSGKKLVAMHCIDGNRAIHKVTGSSGYSSVEILDGHDVRFIELASADANSASFDKTPAFTFYNGLLKHGLEFDINSASCLVVDGSQQNGSFTIENTEDVSKKIILRFPDNSSLSVSVPAKTKRSITHLFDIPDKNAKKYFISVKLGNEEFTLPVEIINQNPCELIVDEKIKAISGMPYSLHVKLKNNLSKPLLAELNITTAGKLQITPIKSNSCTLAKNAADEIIYAVNIPASAKPFTETCTIGLSVDGKRIADKKLNFDVMCSRKTAISNFMNTPPVIDGTLTEWNSFAPLLIGGDGASVKIKDYKGANDASAKVWLGWDDNFLYFAAEVKDDKFCQNETGATLWRGDSMQIAVLDGICMNNGVTGREIDLALAQTAASPIIYNYQMKKNSAGGKIGIVRKDGLICYEAAIPWQELNIKPSINSVISCSFVVSDNDNEKFKGWLEWTPGVFGNKNSEAWGILRLVK